MSRKDIRNHIVDCLLSADGLPTFQRAVDAMITLDDGKDKNELQPLYDLRGMLLKLAAEPPAKKA